jgi:hypothetical protein
MTFHSSIMDEICECLLHSFVIKGSFIAKEFKMLSPFYNMFLSIEILFDYKSKYNAQTTWLSSFHTKGHHKNDESQQSNFVV